MAGVLWSSAQSHGASRGALGLVGFLAVVCAGMAWAKTDPVIIIGVTLPGDYKVCSICFNSFGLLHSVILLVFAFSLALFALTSIKVAISLLLEGLSVRA